EKCSRGWPRCGVESSGRGSTPWTCRSCSSATSWCARHTPRTTRTTRTTSRATSTSSGNSSGRTWSTRAAWTSTWPRWLSGGSSDGHGEEDALRARRHERLLPHRAGGGRVAGVAGRLQQRLPPSARRGQRRGPADPPVRRGGRVTGAPTVEDMELATGKVFQAHQLEALADAQEQVDKGVWLRLCLYHRTGAGKTLTSLACVRLTGAGEVLVLAPPITHDAWVAAGRELGLQVSPISHAKFRQKTYKVRRDQAMIVDEFHLLGGHKGIGWKKLDRIARGLQAPLVIASATPNYNDAERVYCIQHVLDPDSARGGYLQFLYDRCVTRVNPFGQEPIVEGFRYYADAEDYLKHLPHVHYVEDEAIKQVSITDVELQVD